MVKIAHVLIVEDSVDLGRELRESIKDLQGELSIVAAPSAEEGILEIGRHPIDLLVTDFRLPGISGLELVRRVRRKYPQVKVILTTAVLDAQLEKEAEDLQVSLVLQKPVDIAGFQAAVAAELMINANLPKSPPKPPVVEAPKPAEPAKGKKEDDSFSKTLFNVQRLLNSRCILWMDGEGGIEKAFGDLPPDLPRDVISKSAIAVLDASREMGNLLLAAQKTGIHYQQGISSDLLAASSQPGVLIAIFTPGLDAASVGEKVRILCEKTAEVAREATAAEGGGEITGGPSAKLKAQPGKTGPASGEQDLEEILGGGGKVTSGDADTFWENAGSEAKPDLGNPDLLTYEQAQKMGFKVKK